MMLSRVIDRLRRGGGLMLPILALVPGVANAGSPIPTLVLDAVSSPWLIALVVIAVGFLALLFPILAAGEGGAINADVWRDSICPPRSPTSTAISVGRIWRCATHSVTNPWQNQLRFCQRFVTDGFLTNSVWVPTWSKTTVCAQIINIGSSAHFAHGFGPW
jgi:hypothetical protein